MPPIPTILAYPQSRQYIQQGIPFEITAKEDHFYSEVNQKRLLAAMKRMEETGGTPHELIEVEGD